MEPDKTKRTQARRKDFPSALGRSMMLRGKNPSTRITSKASKLMASLSKDIFIRLSKSADKVCSHRGALTLTPRDIEAACRLEMPSELTTIAIEFANEELQRPEYKAKVKTS